MNLCNQIIDLLAFVATTHFVFVVESETTFHSFKIQLIVVPPTIKTHPMVLLLVSLSLVESTSTYPCRTMSEPPKHNALEVVPLKYLESIVLSSNALYLDCSYTNSQLPLHVQYPVLCAPWHTSSY